MLILLSDCDEALAEKVLSRIRENVDRWNGQNAGESLVMSISLGFATGRTGEEMKRLIKTADEEMYRDKQLYYKNRNLPGRTGS